MKLLLKGGRVIDPATALDEVMDILIEDSKIVAMGSYISASEACLVDVRGKIVAPGLIDMHTHLREPGYEDKEDIASGTKSAAKGGFTSVACMPNTEPPLDDQAKLQFVLDKARREGVVNVFPIGCITKGRKGEELTEIAELKRSGAVAISDDGQSVPRSDLLRRALEYAGMFNLPVIEHCEDKDLAQDGVMNEGYMSTVLGLRGIPEAAEEIIVARDIILAEMSGSHIHIAHASTARTVELIREAKQRGVKVTAEATPHHLILTEEAVSDYNTNTKVNPPLRTEDDVEALRVGLVDGTIDAIATDHAPHTIEDKQVEYDYAPFGISGLETAVPLLITHLVQPGIISLSDLISKMTIEPARILRLDKGRLEVGGEADITVIDLDREDIVEVAEFESRGKNSPFQGWKLRGYPSLTIVGGRIVFSALEKVISEISDDS